MADINESIKNVLSGQVEFAVLFGSAASSHMNAESDIDIGAYLLTPKIGFREYVDLKIALSDVTERDVDLVIMNTCDIIIAMQILANGTVIINNNPGLFVLYKAEKTGEYIDFKMDRKIIEDNLLRGGAHV